MVLSIAHCGPFWLVISRVCYILRVFVFFLPFVLLLLPAPPEIRKHLLPSATHPQLAAFLFTVSPISSEGLINYTIAHEHLVYSIVKYYAHRRGGQAVRTTIKHGDPAKINPHKNPQEDKVLFLSNFFIQHMA